jgi:hypothetical protein
MRIVVFVQENKTPDFYFASLAGWGADVRNDGGLLSAPPDYDQPHDRSAWVHYAMGDYPAVTVQVDTDTVIPYYAWLAKQFTFCDHHFGLGSNSTSGHMLVVGGQAATLRNPPSSGTQPVWDLPTILRHAERSGHTWAAFPDATGYPTRYYAELTDATGAPNVHPPAAFIDKASSGTLPDVCIAWSPAGYDEHPPQTSDPQYVERGQGLVWQRIDAVVKGGGWDDTVFILTWDDWGGYADHVATPDAERVPDALHPDGFQVIGGSRIPLLVFGGRVVQGVESEWHSHASIAKTIIDLLGLPAFGVPRVDTAPSLAARVDTAGPVRPAPPAYGATIEQPPPPAAPQQSPTGPWTGPNEQPLPDLIANGGKTIPAPADGTVARTPPKLPPQAG